MRHLINNDGVPFTPSELCILRTELDTLDNDERTLYRNQNASAIAHNNAKKFLIVSGPGTGKSHLFLNRINYWYRQDPQAKVFVTSFVRKLVADLQTDINDDTQLTSEQKKRITASTLHKFARSIVEQNHGTTNWPFYPHFRIIGQLWKSIVWGDTLSFYSSLDKSVFNWKAFETQLYDAEFDQSENWQNLKTTYYKLCRFYNAAGFADLILRAKDALIENPQIIESNYFIIDEYQDFNAAEDALINQLVADMKSLLVVGDDEQVLYEKLKSGKPTLIRNLYQNNGYANGMLPFCGRSSFHITKAAGHFIQQHRMTECIEKIYLPIKTADDNPKVQIVACATAPTAVDYIENFVSNNKAAINERKVCLANGEAKDAFLLILTPAKDMNFYGKSKEKIKHIAAEYRAENCSFSEDYYKILSYYSLANNPRNNFTFRKVLYYENVTERRAHALLAIAMRGGHNLCDLESEEIKSIIQKCNEIKAILETVGPTTKEKIESVARYTTITDKARLNEDITQKSINKKGTIEIEHQEEEDAELEEIGIKKMGAIELLTIIGSKGLSADHVIIVGFDDVNMNWITQNAFYVAITRARKSLHILTALKSGGAHRAHNFLNQLPDDNIEFYSYKKNRHMKTQLQNKQDFNNYLSRLILASRHRG